MKLKVCGLTKITQVHELISMKVDFLGFIFYEKSPRYVMNHMTLKEISEVKHQAKVGVFVNEGLDKIVEISEKADLHYIQLHGDENQNYIAQLRNKLKPEIKIIKVFRVGINTENLKSKIQDLESNVSYFLFDTDSKAFGGTGKTFDWQILNDLEITKPYLLSGGISLENFNEIKDIQNIPFALDINSKFETEPGVKDLEKIKQLYEKL